MHVYKVEVDQRSLGYYEAKSKNEARVAALKHVTVERIDSSEVIKLMKQGIAIVSADTGYVCNGEEHEPETTPDPRQQALDIEDAEAPAGADYRELGG